MQNHEHEIRIDMKKKEVICFYCRKRLSAVVLLSLLGGWYGLGRHDEMTEYLRRLQAVKDILKERAGRGQVFEGTRTLEEAEAEVAWKG